MKIVRAPNAGLINGIIIVKKILISEAPSIFALSMSDAGISSQNCLHKKIPNALMNDGKIKAPAVLYKPKKLINMNDGIIVV